MTPRNATRRGAGYFRSPVLVCAKTIKAIAKVVEGPWVKNGGILMLAPTGKARVRMEEQIGIRGGQTIAQFLLRLQRYYPNTGKYYINREAEKYKGAKTVIIDEASMLTEPQLAAVFDALAGVDRLILAGDPRQLPPIGSGRPFVDIVQELMPDNVESIFPRIAKGYAELTVCRRQKGKVRDDLLLANWFGGHPLDPGADEIWVSINEDTPSEQLRFVSWKTSDDLRRKLLDTLAEELIELRGLDAVTGFECSLGGKVYENYGVFFWPGQLQGNKVEGGAAAKAEAWQVLSPVRNEAFGVESLNRFIQQQYQAQKIVPYEPGIDAEEVLITTRDDECGGIRSDDIEQLIDTLLGD
ncbi:MAG: AAA family ATPase [Gammaproteobacteria bacterium]|nr:AAA family ATPase [Gammaproteobacteria bacterium]